MRSLLKKLIGGGLTRTIIISLFATLAVAGIVKAATTIGDNIATGGNLDVTGAATLSGGFFTTTVADLGTAISNASTGETIYVKNEAASVDQINITSKTNLIIDGQGATLTLNNGTNAAIFNISGGSRITIRNFNFVGPNTGTYNATNKHRGVVVTDDASYVVIESSSFSGFDSQGVYVENVGGMFDISGAIITKCVFKDFLYDSSTDEQTGIYLGTDGEYTTIKGNYFTNIPSAIRSITGNVSITNNMIAKTNATSEVGAPSATKGLIYVSYNTNSGKYIITNNVINHNNYNVIPLQLYGDATAPQNSFIVTNNFILLNTLETGTRQQIRATEVDNSVFANNVIRAPEGTATEAVVEIIDSDNVQLSGNHIMNGTYGIKATASASKTTSLNLSNNIIRNYTAADVVTSGSGIASISPKFQKQFIGQALDILHSSGSDVKLLLSPNTGDTGSDYSSYAHTVTPTGYTSANVFQDGEGYSISGASGRYYTVADADEFSFSGTGDTAFSVGGFFNLASENSVMLMAKNDASDVNPEWSFYINPSNQLVLLLRDKSVGNSGKIAQISTASYTAGKHCVVATYDGGGVAGGIKLYVDGILFASSAYAPGGYVAMENTSTPVTINAFPDGTWNRTGATTQAFIVGRQLAADDVRAYCLAGGMLGY